MENHGDSGTVKMGGVAFLLLFCTIEQNKKRRVDIDPLVSSDGLFYSPELEASGVQRVYPLAR